MLAPAASCSAEFHPAAIMVLRAAEADLLKG